MCMADAASTSSIAASASQDQPHILVPIRGCARQVSRVVALRVIAQSTPDIQALSASAEAAA